MSKKVKGDRFWVCSPSSITSEAGKRFSLEVMGRPQPMTRARTARNHFYNPAQREMEVFRGLIKSHMRNQMVEKPIFPKGVAVEVTLEFDLTKSGSRQPDLDNLCKFVMDCANGLVYADDIQVVRLCAEKRAYKSKKDVGVTRMVVKKVICG